MKRSYVFGYGSLVNSATHSYQETIPTQLRGFRRTWVKTPMRDVVFLSVAPDDQTTIDGLAAAVPESEWPNLDRRETGYERQIADHALSPWVYVIPEANLRARGDHVILRSYLDVVVQGFLREFGEDGVARFFETTDGWNVGILDDRDDPRYPRHQILTAHETGLVDEYIVRFARLA